VHHEQTVLYIERENETRSKKKSSGEDKDLTECNAFAGIASCQEFKPGATGTNIVCQAGCGIKA
jgi:hypothetical protein